MPPYSVLRVTSSKPVYKRLMDNRLRGTFHKLYLTAFWMLLLGGIGGLWVAVLGAFTEHEGHYVFCPAFDMSQYKPITDLPDSDIREETLNKLLERHARSNDCPETFVAVVASSFLPLLTLVITKKWLLWLLSDWRSPPRPESDDEPPALL